MLHISHILNLILLSILWSQLIILHSWGSKVLFQIHWIVSTIYLPNFPVSLIFSYVAPIKMPHCGKSLIDYKHGRPSTPITTTIISPTTPATPTPLQGPPWKRQHVEADQSSDSNSSDIYVPEKWWMFFLNLDYEMSKIHLLIQTSVKHWSYASSISKWCS